MVRMVEHSDPIPGEQTVTHEAFREPVSSLQVELTRVSAGIRSINSGFHVQFQGTLLESYRQVREEVQAEFILELDRHMSRTSENLTEIERASEALDCVTHEIEGMLDDREEWKPIPNPFVTDRPRGEKSRRR